MWCVEAFPVKMQHVWCCDRVVVSWEQTCKREKKYIYIYLLTALFKPTAYWLISLCQRNVFLYATLHHLTFVFNWLLTENNSWKLKTYFPSKVCEPTQLKLKEWSQNNSVVFFVNFMNISLTVAWYGLCSYHLICHS